MKMSTTEQAAPEVAETESKLTPDVSVPPRSRTFTEDDARAILAGFAGVSEADATDDTPAREPWQNTGYGSFKTAGAARSAGVSLNNLLVAVGAPHKYAIRTFVRDGKHVGVLLNKPAKHNKTEDETPAETPAPAPARSGGSGRRRRR